MTKNHEVVLWTKSLENNAPHLQTLTLIVFYVPNLYEMIWTKSLENNTPHLETLTLPIFYVSNLYWND